MTLIAITAGRDFATLLTDSRSYTHTATSMGHMSKVTTFPHIDLAIADQGSSTYGIRWRAHLAKLVDRAYSFDDLVRRAPNHLRAVWDVLQESTVHENAEFGTDAEVASSVIFHVGYSEEQRRFIAIAHCSDTNFDPQEIEGLHVMPSPLDRRPSDIELRRLERHLPFVHGEDTTLLDFLRSQPVRPAPRNEREWIALAKTVRAQRSVEADLLTTGLKTFVGGEAYLTQMRRGQISQRRVHRFDDSGVEFAQMMAGSLHPVGQLGECQCGSGLTYVDCCLVQIADQPCPCRSGIAFAGCCSVRALDLPRPRRGGHDEDATSPGASVLTYSEA